MKKRFDRLLIRSLIFVVLLLVCVLFWYVGILIITNAIMGLSYGLRLGIVVLFVSGLLACIPVCVVISGKIYRKYGGNSVDPNAAAPPR